ncbi:MAG TPA: hypothetical protein DFR83_23110 [Deltaproteobacteria bacterium]|nr:hypothetical protein [Deltaproteobacteria bacterium]
MEQALSGLAQRLDTDAPLAFARTICSDAEPYELGLAISIGTSTSTDSALLSYNPRTRGSGARRRMLTALARHGIDPTPAELAFELVPDVRASTVLGIEWRTPTQDGPAAKPSATLYLEEVSRFFAPREAAKRMRAFARLAGVDLTEEIGRPGPLYIWALDLTSAGIRAFKVYRLADGTQAPAVRSTTRTHAGGALSPGADQLLFGGAPASAFIVQKRYAPGRPAPLKVYKCHPYQDRGTDLTTAKTEVWSAVQHYGSALAHPTFADLPPTSLGLRFAPGSATPRGGTAYWCLALQR